MTKPLDIVIFGLSITSSWGNGHATTFRALVRALSARGHNVCFLERDMPWYAEHRDLPDPPYGLTQLYNSVAELKKRFTRRVMNADLCIVGSYVPDGVEVGEWVLRTCRGVRAFYDIDTPITLAKLAAGDTEYVTASMVRRYDLYLSFSGNKNSRRGADVSSRDHLAQQPRTNRTPCAGVSSPFLQLTALYTEPHT